MITVRHVRLPAGLSALALPGHDGNMTVFLSDTIAPDQQRAAVRAALGASRRAGWRGALLPVGAAALAFRSRSLLGGFVTACRNHAVLTAAAAGTAATVAVATTVIALVPHHSQPVTSAGSASPGRTHVAVPGGQNSPAHRPGAKHPNPARHSRRAGHQAAAPAPGSPKPTASATLPGPTPTPRPSPTPTSRPTPTPSHSAHPTATPSPTPTSTGGGGGGGGGSGGGSGGGLCVWLLGVKVCASVAASVFAARPAPAG